MKLREVPLVARDKEHDIIKIGFTDYLTARHIFCSLSLYGVFTLEDGKLKYVLYSCLGLSKQFPRPN